MGISWWLFVVLFNVNIGCDGCSTDVELSGLSNVLDSLAVKMRNLEQHVSDIEATDYLSFHHFRDTKLKLAALEGFQCPRPRFHYMCTATGMAPDRRCLDNHLACDGIKHCPDGEDEVDCDIARYINPGDVYHFTVTNNECRRTNFQDGDFTILSVVSHPVYPNMHRVITRTLCDTVNDDGSLTHVNGTFLGEWNYGSHSLVLGGRGVLNDGIDHIHSYSPYDGGASGVIIFVKEISGQACARISIKRIYRTTK